MFNYENDNHTRVVGVKRCKNQFEHTKKQLHKEKSESAHLTDKIEVFPFLYLV